MGRDNGVKRSRLQISCSESKAQSCHEQVHVSCSPEEAGREAGMGASMPEAVSLGGEVAYSGRVSVMSKGEVLRSQPRQKDRPPDPGSLLALR